ncbi:hypothetical protein [Glycomyces rhizosphaerae]|uniref:Uncharacterized protein n=1 Tax=Glycomyces rhizosphaerae TaxID=2054422 RepID=A0ABV7PX90_9ACTN
MGAERLAAWKETSMGDHSPARVPFDVETYVGNTKTGKGFFCALVAGEPGFFHEVV